MEIRRGKIRKGVKFLVYGPEGIGKSTFVSRIPGVVFIDTEGSTGELDVPRLPTPTSWQMLLTEVDYAIDHPQEVPALVIDTGDWAERLCIEHVLQTHLVNGRPMQSIEDAGYGRGYVYLAEEFGRLLDKMQLLSDRGVHCGFTAHAMMRKFEQPDELGAYDRWELKMSKKVSPLLKEWSSLMLFANYKTMVYATDKDARKHKASGGARVMYANHHPCWDAKNRYGLPDEMPFDFDQVATVFAPIQSPARNPQPAPAAKQPPQQPAPAAPQNPQPDATPEPPQSPPQAPPSPPQVPPQGPQVPPESGIEDAAPLFEPAPGNVEVAERLPDSAAQDRDPYAGVPEKLAVLMREDGITPFEIRAAVAQKGYFPMETPFENYPADFVNSVLIAAWPDVKKLCLHNRENLPF